MKGNLQEMKKDFLLIKMLVEKLESEINKVESYPKSEKFYSGQIKTAYNKEYSLEKIKRYCTEARSLLLEIKKYCTER